MNKNRLTIASAGSGKTTFLVNHALDVPVNENVLITTYTEANEEEIKRKIHKSKGFVPSNITVQTWFSFLIKHGVKPFQGSLDDSLFEKDIHGMYLVNSRSGKRYNGPYGPVYFAEGTHFKQHYFTSSARIYSDKLSKFVIKCDKLATGAVIDRVSKIFAHIFIDEVQDLAGYDLEIIKSLFKTESTVFLIGDPRQVTYLTHNEAKNSKYRDGNIELYIEEKCKSLIKDGIDKTSLNVSHRNNESICSFSSLLYPAFPLTSACTCSECKSNTIDHQGIFLIRPNEAKQYLERYNPVQLRWDNRTQINSEYNALNFGESKGQEFDRVLIYPTKDMCAWLIDNSADLKSGARAKLYVAITRARYSAAFIYDYSDDIKIDNTSTYKFN